MIKFYLKNNKGFTHATKFTNLVRGFTLLEALVAISVLMVAIAAPITIAQKGLSSAVYTKSQMIASYLAQDAIEYVKNKRDENVMNERDWLDGFADCLEPAFCRVDTIASGGVGLISPDSGSPKILYKDSNNFYGYNGTVETNFTRKVIITKVSDIEAKLNVVVQWGTDVDNKVDVTTLIYNY